MQSKDMSYRSQLIASKGRRTPGRPGRFDPSEPLHMTTRHAARNSRTNGTPSSDGSIDGDESRRRSLDDGRPLTSQSLGSQTSAKGRQVSGTSINGASDLRSSFNTQSSAENLNEQTKTKIKSPVLQPPSPSRKRKRSTPTPPETPERNDDDFPPPANSASYVNPVVNLQSYLREESEDESEQDDRFRGHYLDVAQSTEMTPAMTPAASEPASPGSEQSNAELEYSGKMMDIAMPDGRLPVEDPDGQEIDDAEELAEEVDDIEDADDMDDDQERMDGKGRRRLAGRRRADHPVPAVESTLRRQLQLKSAYRAIARALKPVLAEIALKTVEEVDASSTRPEQMLEYQCTEDEAGMREKLDDLLQKRKAQLDAQLRWSKLQLQKTLDGEREVRRSRCKLQLEDLRESHLDRLEHDWLAISRRAQMDDGEAANETEDEEGEVIPRTHRAGYRFITSDALDPKYESRSRVALEVGTAVKELQLRFEMQKLLQDFRDEEHPAVRPDFTVMDSTPRHAAVARKEGIRNTNMLADAATEAERVAKIPIIANQDVPGLQLLGELADRPSIRAPVPMPTANKQSTEEIFGPPLHRRLPPNPPSRPPFMADGVHISPGARPSQDRTPLPAASLHPDPNEYSSKASRLQTPFILPQARASTLGPVPSGISEGEQTPNQRSFPPDRIPGRTPRSDSTELGASATPFFRDDLSREQYQRPLGMERESRPNSDRIVHDFSAGGPLSIERVEPAKEPDDRRSHASPLRREGIRIEPPTQHGPYVEAPHWEMPRTPGAADSRQASEQAPLTHAWENGPESLAMKPPSRASSASQSTAADVSQDDSSLGDSTQHRPKPKIRHGEMAFQKKTSKAERNGLTRRVYRGRNKDAKRPGREGGPSVFRFRLNQPVETPSQQQATPWNRRPSTAAPPTIPLPYDPYSGANPPPYAPPAHSMPAHYGPPPYQGPPPYEYSPPYGHRNSYPPPGGSAYPPWPNHAPPPPPPSPLYALPQGSGPMPPHEPQWAVGAPGYGRPAPPPSMQSVPPPGAPQGPPHNHKFSGTPIAPADGRQQGAYSGAQPAHPPAFAQQQRHQESGDRRRRTQSDVQGAHHFKQWTPRSSR